MNPKSELTTILAHQSRQWWLIRLCAVFVFSLTGIGMMNQPVVAAGRWIAVGRGDDATMATSLDGTNWTSQGKAIFSQWGQGVAWNGSMWVAVGVGENTVAHSTNGVDWTGLGDSIFDYNQWTQQGGGYGVAWGDNKWVAVGNAPNNFATSADGINWVGRGGVNIFGSNPGESGLDVAWNGTMWVAVGGGNNTIAYSYDGISWTGLGKGIFSNTGVGIAWNETMWVAVGYGANTIAYSYDGINWTGLGNSIFTNADGYGGMDLAWNGSRWVAVAHTYNVGTDINVIATSIDGINWVGLGGLDIFSPPGGGGTSVAWGDGKWIAAGNNVTNTFATSTNGTTWTGLGSSVFTNNGAAFDLAWGTTPLPGETDCGLRVYDGIQTLHFACVPAGPTTSELRVKQNGSTYSIVLVPPGDPNATRVRINTNNGIKALKKFGAAPVNQPPVLDPIGNKNGAEGTAMSFTISASDPDQATGDSVTITAANLPSGSSLGNTTYNAGTGKFEATFTWTPSYTQSGSYPNIVFTATDTASATDTESITITIANTNQPPVLDPIGNKNGSEGVAMSFVVRAADPDSPGDTVTISVANKPSGSNLSNTSYNAGLGKFEATFTWTPSYTQSGSYPNIVFTATDTASATDTESITITIADVPNCPDTQCNNGETCSTCPADCGACCGNGACVAPENCSNCSADCGNCCGDGSCNFGENCTSCPGDCGACFCGDTVCNNGETCSTCPGDCGSCCGNGQCIAPETCSSCAADCGACPRRVRRYISAANMTEVENYATITAAINDTDTVAGNVLVTDSTGGWYFWNEGIIDFQGKSITLKSQDMIPQNNEIPHVVFNGGTGSILEGFYIVGFNNPWGDPVEPYCVTVNGNATATVRNNEIYNCVTAGVKVETGSNATINDNLIYGNCRGVYVWGGSATITWNTIRDGMSGTMNCTAGGPGIMCLAGTVSATIQNNNINHHGGGSGSNGGGVNCQAGTANISSNSITSNDGKFGGGIYFRGSGTVSNNTLTGNTALGTGVSNRGGGGGADIGGTVTFSGNTVTSNVTDGAGAGVSATYNGGTFTITGNTITQNTSGTSGSYGGGISSGGNASTSTTITNNTISNNAVKYSGGGINHWGGYANISNNTISNNTIGPTESGGAGIAFAGGGGALIEKNAVFRNTILPTYGYGGGMLLTVLYDAPGNLINVRNNTVAYNTTSGEGGGVFVNNSTNLGACLAQNPVFDSSIVWANTAPISPSIGQMSNPWPLCAKVQYSDIQGGWSGFGSNNINADPRFINSAANDYHLLAGSPCINTGNPAFGAGTDMGAFPYP
ncbi:MAG: right-handed parallel beta-helix repeat-containing protein [Patescibacteria group bacterium]|jgi:hypothetical protein